MPVRSLKGLLHPFPVEQFLAEHRGRNWLHVKGAPMKVGNMLNWDGLNTILNMEVWNRQNLLLVQDTQSVPPQAYCRQRVDRSLQPQLVPLPELVQQHLANGASLVLNEVETLLPDARGLVRAFADGLGAKCSANAYISQRNHQAFDTHFDRTDVFAVQTLGRKRWRIYRGQVDTPVIHAMFTGMSKQEVERLKGGVEAEVVMNPGDVLYIPRGRFHDALATEGPSMHLSCAVSEPKGLDVMRIVSEAVVGDPLFRADLPLQDEDLPAYLKALADRLQGMTSSPEMVEQVKGLRAGFVPARPDFQLGPKKRK